MSAQETSALLTSLQAMFPQLPLNTIQSAVQSAKSNDEAINTLLEIQTKQESTSSAATTNDKKENTQNNTVSATEPVKEERQRARGRSVVSRAEGIKRALSELNERELRYWSTSELLELNHLLATTSLLVTMQMQSRLGIKPQRESDDNETINSAHSLNTSTSHVHTPLLTGSNNNSPRVRRRQDSVNSVTRDSTGARDSTGTRDNNEDEWVVMEGQSRASESSSTLKSTLQKLTACSMKGCTNLGNECCPRCRARFCREHASMMMTSTHATRGQVVCLTCCDDMLQKPGVTRTHTGLYLTLRHNSNGTANEFVQTHRDVKMQPRIKELASKPFNPIDSLTSMLPFNNLILTNKDTWTTCSQCGAYFDRLSLKRPCRVCPQVFCGRCDYQLQVRTFNVKELFTELPSRVIEEEVCAKCKKVIDKMRRKNKWHLIQEQFAAKPVVQICSNKFEQYLKLKAESQRDLDDAAKNQLVNDARALTEELQTLLIDQAKVLTQAELLLFARLRQSVMLFIAQLKNDALRVDDWNMILPNKEKIMTMSVPIQVSREEVMTSSPSPKNSLNRMHSSIVLGEKDASAKSSLTRVSSVVLSAKNSTSPPHSPSHDG